MIDRTTTTRSVEALVNAHAAAGLDPVALALTMLAAGADLLTKAWDAPRALAAFDQLVTIAADPSTAATKH